MSHTYASLRIVLASVAWCGGVCLASAAGPLFPPLGNDEAWELLPRANPPLPTWARTLAPSLPRTTVAMLELDYLHRANNPLGRTLAGKLRWMVAHAIGCAYGERYAEADLRRAGLPESDVKSLAGDLSGLPGAECAALAFARKLTRAGHTVTDAEVTDLLNHFGAEKVVALVHTVAYANFQNRIFLALKVEVESGGPPEPPNVRLAPGKGTKPAAPARLAWEEVVKAKPSARTNIPEGWEERTIADLEKALQWQKNRKGRIPLPGPERLAKIPAEAKAESSLVRWTTVSMGYQPRLTTAWFDCMRTFRQEAKLDRVFSGFLFWIVTRSNECFY